MRTRKWTRLYSGIRREFAKGWVEIRPASYHGFYNVIWQNGTPVHIMEKHIHPGRGKATELFTFTEAIHRARLIARIEFKEGRSEKA